MCCVTALWIVISPPVSTAAAINPPTSRWSESTVHSPPLSSDTQTISNVLDQMPDIFAPRLLRKRHNSWVCGSQAALRMMVLPGVLQATNIAISVPVTDGNHCHISVALRPLGASR